MNKFNVLVSEVKAALLFASNDDARFVLMGVCFHCTPGKKPILVSTDGKRLCVIESQASPPADIQDEPDGQFIVSAEFLRLLCQFSKPQAPTLSIEFHPPKRCIFELLEGHCAVDSEEGAVIEGVYPDWRQIIPNGVKTPVSEMAINAEYVGDYAKAAKFLGTDVPGIIMNIFDADGAMEVQLSGKPNFYGVIMPMKNADKERNWQPEFLGLGAEATTANQSIQK